MTPTQALTAIQTMPDHSQKWHNGTLSRSLSSNSNIDGLVAIVSKLDNLGRDMKKLKENVHAIQVGCQICKGPHLDKEYPLNEEAKQVENAKYMEFGLLDPYNEKKRPSLEELINKHLEELARRSTKMNEWIKKLQESAEVNTRNQSTLLKNLETQIEQLTKELYSRATNEIPNKVVNDDLKTQHRPISSRKLINKEGWTTKDLQCQLPPKEQNPRNFTFLALLVILTFTVFRSFLATVHAKINVFDKEISLGTNNDRVIYDMEKRDHNFIIPTEKIFMIKSYLNNRPLTPASSSNQPRDLNDRSLDNSLHDQNCKKIKFELDQHIPRVHFCKPVKQTIAKKTKMWLTCDPTKGTPSQETKNLRPSDYTFREWTLLKVRHTDISEPVKKALLKLWVIDYFRDESRIIKEPLARSFNDYKWVFDLEINQLADEYKLGIKKRGICLIRYGNTVKMFIEITHTGGMIIGLKKRNVKKWESKLKNMIPLKFQQLGGNSRDRLEA
nr:hypothetical protein [Tanacetum cinerariifolium]